MKTYTLRQLGTLLGVSHATIRTTAMILADAGQIEKRQYQQPWKLTVREAWKVRAWLRRPIPEDKETWSLRDVADELGTSAPTIMKAARELIKAGQIRRRDHSKAGRRWDLNIHEIVMIKKHLEANPHQARGVGRSTGQK